jgi:hypothetical protein
MKKTLTPEQTAKRDARRAAFQALAKRIAAMSPTDREALAAQSPIVTIEGRALSPFNMCLVAMQLPAATVVGGFRQWLKAGRAVMKGQHGASIWVPCGAKSAPDESGETSTEKTFFTAGTVFDVSQTSEIEDANEDSTPGTFADVIETNPATLQPA